MANRLTDEQSPYLQQHAHNPVDWYPWCDEAFERAKNENKPVLVSIGYAACHWCHVMERESFEDEATAAYMNEHYINIKVDREEHPDVDHMYMDAVQAITQSGGWPLNAFVTPERVPFFGGTYFPPKPLYGRPSWRQVLEQIHNVWSNQQGEVDTQVTQMRNYLKQISTVATGSKGSWVKEACRKAADNMLAGADKEHGGFGAAPKFPVPMSLSFLLEHYMYTGYAPALEHALKSLDKMAEGGIYDQLGGGFARYSTDAHWLAPHFEKMLYDNALLIEVYCTAYHLTGDDKYKKVIAETIDFINRELKSEEGGFYCALDADSEGVEGKFYTWTWDEWQEATGENKLAEAYFGISQKGNWEGTNILHIVANKTELAKEHGLAVSELEQQIADVKQKLLAVRSKRIRPATDDKCLLSWNALMNTALTKAGQILGDDSYIKQAEEHMQWMLDSYYTQDGLKHTYKNGTARIAAKLDDHAYLVAAMIQLASANNNHDLILKASELAEKTEQDFLHEDRSFFYFSSAKQTDIPVRKVDLYDSPIPSANSVMAANLVWLGMIMEKSAWTEQGQYMINQLQDATLRYPSSFPNWAVLNQRKLAGFKTAVLTGESAIEPERNSYPHVCFLAALEAKNEVPLLAGKAAASAAAVYVCDAESCKPPVSDQEVLKEMLGKSL